MNESVYRSPKWLRNFVDFELHTGEDIKGNVSKHEVREEKKRLLKLWEERWENMRSDTNQRLKFYEFCKSEFSIDVGYSDIDRIKKQWQGNFELWTRYDAWILKEKERKEESDRISKELDDLWDRILEDFRKYPYSDKYSTPTINGEVVSTYRFENGDIFKLFGNKISYGGYTYTISTQKRIKFVQLVNHINSSGRNRPGQNNGRKYTKTNWSSDSKYSSHPKWNVYKSIKDTITQREAQLAKMSKNDPERKALENELEAAKRRVSEMKSKYQFENLISFFDFNLEIK